VLLSSDAGSTLCSKYPFDVRAIGEWFETVPLLGDLDWRSRYPFELIDIGE
jgi:hypothetical protein